MKSVYSIPAGVPFLPTLAEAVISGRLGPTGDPDDPLALAGTTILLPTRRAMRALRGELLSRMPGRAAILPRIRPIGDVDEEAQLLDAQEDPADAFVLPPAISRLERLLSLSGLVHHWGRTVRRTLLALSPDEPLLIPASAADAVRLAADLARLIDDMEVAGLSWQALERLTPQDYPRYWQIALDFLKIAAEAWPAYLAERGLADPAERRDRLLRAEAERFARRPPVGLVVAAGSTGTVPATAALLAAIAALPNGAVVLPGLDLALDQAAFAAIGDPADASRGAPSHPQAGLRQLLGALGVDRSAVVELGPPPSPPLAARAALLSEAMRPAETTEAWATAPPASADAFAGVDLLVARNEQEEALAIAVALRESVETPGGTAALVTPDRTLARRVGVELGRWGIRVDDSAGRPLDGTREGVFARLVAEAAITADPVTLLALAKHPIASFGMRRQDCRRAARALEVALFRGPGPAVGVSELPAAVADVRLRTEMAPRSDRSIPRARRRLGVNDWNLAEKLARRIAAALGPVSALCSGGDVEPAEMTRRLGAALEAAADQSLLWAEPAGEALAGLLAGLLGAGPRSIAATEYPAFLRAAMAAVAVAPPVGTDTRVHIWGTIEARLQSVDLLVLGGLDEGVWPGEARTDPWLSRRMRAAVGLPPPERRIGLAAHDFVQAMAAPHVIVTRAGKRGGAPTVPSRWLQRLAALLGDGRMIEMTARGKRLIRLARRLDHVSAHDLRPAARPAPTPPPTARPRTLSVTSIETLIRDPYAVYARRILQLEAMDPVGQRADPRRRGSLIHEALADFTGAWRGPFDEGAAEALLGYWRGRFAEIVAYPEVHVVWSLRAPRLAEWLVGWEAARAAEIAERHAEIGGHLTFPSPGGDFTLTAKADRIDLRADGRVDIFDYKTGQAPTAKQVLLFAPQLPLEAAMARAGAFGEAFAGRSVAELAWILLGQIGKDRPVRSAVEPDRTADELGAEALRRLRALVAEYDRADKPYVSQARPMFERRLPGEYDHLARVAEWRQAGGAA